jgi:hypothetical protein
VQAEWPRAGGEIRLPSRYNCEGGRGVTVSSIIHATSSAGCFFGMCGTHSFAATALVCTNSFGLHQQHGVKQRVTRQGVVTHR